MRDSILDGNSTPARVGNPKIPSDPLLEAALKLAALGLRIIPLYGTAAGECSCGKPCSSRGKHPRIKDWPNRATTDPETIRSWFAKWSTLNVGIATGSGSRLVAIDVDDRHDGQASLDALLAQHGPLPATWIVSTGNGRHIYFALPDGITIGNSAGLLGRGLDIRGEGGFVVAAGSIHFTGVEYAWGDRRGPDDLKLAPIPEWLIPLGTQSNVAVCAESHIQEAVPAVSHDGSQWPDDVEAAIATTLPGYPGQRNQAVLRLVRRLKAIARLAGCASAELESIVREWHRRAMPATTGSHPVEDTIDDFNTAWRRVKFAYGHGPLGTILARAKAAIDPQCAFDYESEDTRLLIRICRELQRESGDKPFFLGCRTASEMIGADKNTANRRLRLLSRCGGVLQMVSKGTKATGMASEYRYLGDLRPIVRQAA